MVDEDDIDPDLKDLLSQIDDAQVAGATEAELPDEPVKKPKNTKKVEPEPEPEPEPEQSQTDEIDQQLEALGLDPDDLDNDEVEEENPEIDEEEFLEAEVIEDEEVEQKRLELQKNVMGLITKHCNSSEKMFEEAEVDRKRIEEILCIILPRIEADNYKAADIQSVASLLQTKADISGNRSRMMDSISRLLAALKNNPVGNIKAEGGEKIDKEEIKRLLGGGPKA